MTLVESKKIRNLKRLIILLSVVIPAVVAVLFRVKIDGVDLSFLPPVYASINGLTASLLVIALLAIRSGVRTFHERMIKVCLGLSLLFLACYVAYHMTSDPATYYGNYKTLYYIILVSHIVLSVAIIPLVLFTFLFALQGNFSRHKKWARIAWPLWFYVAVSGVIVYLMISPYYPV